LPFSMGDMKIRTEITRLIAGSLMVGTMGGLFAVTGKFLAFGHRVNTQTILTISNQSDPADQAASRMPRIYSVSETIIAIEVPAPKVTLGSQRHYVAQPDDIVTVTTREAGESQSTAQTTAQATVERDGRLIGELVGANNQILYTYDQVEPERLHLAAADSPASYVISSDEDSRYANPVLPISVFRKTKPTAFAATRPGERYVWPVQHTLFLTLPTALTAGQTYRLKFPDLGLLETRFTYEPTVSQSEAVHVSQLGFRPDDPLKLGYLSTWMGNGNGLDYPDGLGFQLIDEQTNAPAYSGTARLIRPQNQIEDPRGNDYTLTEVHRLDFSDFDRVGRYRLCVDTVGCSFPFEISPEVWQRAFVTAARGFYHQRSGIEIGRPYTEFSRPRAFHPDDGVKVYQSEASLIEVGMGLGTKPTFAALTAAKTDQVVANAWGGYFDAGDWDRRIQHLAIPRGLLELNNLFPDYFKAIDLNIPESGNSLPDILDEALWSLDFFRRLQTKEGGIRGGIETAGYPKFGETSWQSVLPVMAYAPDVWSSYMYAGVAARAAYTLARYDSKLANIYQQSALKAMAYAEAHYPEYQAAGHTGELQHHVKDQRNLAALELYRLTGEARWHDMFLATTVFQDAQAEPYIYGQHEQRDAAFLYARLGSLEDGLEGDRAVNLRVQANARVSLLRYADRLVTLTQTTAFGWSKDHPESPLGWANGLGAPKSMNLLQAHVLTQDPKYLLAAVGSTQFAGGANPDNLVFTTGLGDRSPQHPLIIDQRFTGQSPPPGITVYGPADLSFYSDFWTIKELTKSMFPNPRQWPAVESYFDIYLYPLGAEFTVDYMIHPAYTWGYLAARSKQ